MPDFRWLIDKNRTWPPAGILRLPVSVSTIDVMKGCQTKAKFSYDVSLLQRRHYETRIGIAIHKTLETLSEQSSNSIVTLIDIKNLFLTNLQHEEDLASRNPREAPLPKNFSRVQWAINTLFKLNSLVATSRTTHRKPCEKGKVALPLKRGDVRVEIPVMCNNGRIKGRIDRIEFRIGGIHIIDYKTSVTTANAEKYFDQVKLYAALYNETFGIWPVSAELNYPLLNKSFDVKIKQKECLELLSSANSVVDILARRGAVLRSNPGIECGVCDFRPWCEDFWAYLATIDSNSDKLRFGRVGMAGVVIEIQSTNDYQFILLEWDKITVEFNFPKSKFPHLSEVKVGDNLRLLDFSIQGIAKRPNVFYTDFSEVFVVK